MSTRRLESGVTGIVFLALSLLPVQPVYGSQPVEVQCYDFNGGMYAAPAGLVQGPSPIIAMGDGFVELPHTYGSSDSSYSIDYRPHYRLRVDLRNPVLQPDFPPISADPAANTLPLVPAGPVRSSRLLGGARTRLLHEGVMDAALAEPLLRHEDFSLPFGGAVFRHIRTYWGQSAVQNIWTPGGWDWNGRNWMMSEAPLFLIDVGLWWNYGQPRKCYLILDAHHAIPFTFDIGTGRYVAPSWFDAVLEYSQDGELDSDGSWASRPSEFYVYLQQGALKYTIRAVYEDVPVLTCTTAGTQYTLGTSEQLSNVVIGSLHGSLSSLGSGGCVRSAVVYGGLRVAALHFKVLHGPQRPGSSGPLTRRAG